MIVEHYTQDESTEGKIQSDDAFICPHCNKEQDDSPENILMDADNDCIEIECDECGKLFGCKKTVLITYWSFKQI